MVPDGAAAEARRKQAGGRICHPLPKRVGVFATRSPFRPNAIGLSCVRLLGVEKTPEGHVLKVAGADLVNGTPIYDIKPYLPYADCKPDATGGFTDGTVKRTVDVQFSGEGICLRVCRKTDSF